MYLAWYVVLFSENSRTIRHWKFPESQTGIFLQIKAPIDFHTTKSIAFSYLLLKANLEVNKEGMARDLVCLLEIQSRPQDAAELTKLMENFFISGAARIDLIAKVLDLDNDMGGLNFDIPLLEETEDALTSLSEPTGIEGFT